MSWEYPFIPFDQPIGSFIITTIPANEILQISHIDRRTFDSKSLRTSGGPQRVTSPKRINDICDYAETTDATFPTPVLLAVDEGKYRIENDRIIISEERIASVVDGQHRLLGIKKSGLSEQFTLPVVFLLDATEEQKALIFAIINGKQTKVATSLIYDLFGVIEQRNPYKTCHEIARTLNEMEESPFYRRLKMLGRKTPDSNETLSQGTFIKELLKHVSTKPDEDFALARNDQPLPSRPESVFNSYFRAERDEVITKILLNNYRAIATHFEEEWNSPEMSIISKSTGYTAVMKALPHLVRYGQESKDLSEEYFSGIYTNMKKSLDQNSLKLTSEDFPSNSQGVNELNQLILESLRQISG